MQQADSIGALESAARRHTTPCGNGKLAWRVWSSASDSGQDSGSPVLLLHGSAGSWTHWVRNIAALSQRHAVYVPDLPGYGDSDALHGAPTFDNLAAVIWSGFDMLRPERPLVALAGFSFGSVLAECMALARDGQVRKVVLLRGSFNDKTPRPPSGLLKWRHLDDAADLAAAQRHNLAMSMFHDSTLIDEQAVSLHVDNCKRAVTDHAAFFPSRPSGALTRISAPVCGVAGEFDCYGLPDLAEQGRALLRTRPDAQFHLVPRAGHWSMYEAPETVNRILLETLAC